MEDLRVYYLTPEFITRMANRAQRWSEDFIQNQISEFRKTIPDYPEVVEILESVLHARRLNDFHKKIKKMGPEALVSLLKAGNLENDFLEILRAQIEISKGNSRLEDTSSSRAYSMS